MENGRYYTGTDLKFQITLTADGFNQATDRYDIDFYCGAKVIHYTQSNIVRGSNGNFYLLIPTKELAPGMMRMVITAYVPDTDFPKAVRKEVESITLGPLKNPV